jgi:hypothetical protein
MLMSKIMTSDESAFALGGLEEVNRRHLVREASIVDILKNEIHTMQGMINAAHIRIKDLVSENLELKKKIK